MFKKVKSKFLEFTKKQARTQLFAFTAEYQQQIGARFKKV